MNQPDLSVIMPAYNTERFLGEAIESVLEHADRLLELIVIDDGSSDDTASIASSYGPPVRLISQANQGPAAARNAGIAAARGAYLGFLDADDVWVAARPDPRLQKLDDDASVAGAAGHCRFFVDGADGQRTLVLEPLTGREMGALILRREVFDVVDGFDESFPTAEDVDLWQRIKEAGLQITTLDTLVFLDRLRPGSLTRDRDEVLRGWMQAGRLAMQRQRSREGGA